MRAIVLTAILAWVAAASPLSAALEKTTKPDDKPTTPAALVATDKDKDGGKDMFGKRKELSQGDAAPDFALPDQDGKITRLSELRGKYVVLYFYPKADTPGCTKEACEFTDNIAAFDGFGAVVIGMSADTVEAQKAFEKKHNLKVRLLSDTGLDTLKAYGVVAPDKKKGMLPVFPDRTTYIITPEGKIDQIWKKVNVSEHVQEVRERLEYLTK